MAVGGYGGQVKELGEGFLPIHPRCAPEPGRCSSICSSSGLMMTTPFDGRPMMTMSPVLTSLVISPRPTTAGDAHGAGDDGGVTGAPADIWWRSPGRGCGPSEGGPATGACRGR